ncbi:MAG TPA: tetratricopeptide repeat protein [Verrucomicrobiae bacterium]|nr:tetratricopeptide repeat protein [Verrucomicrobiae bacterium]
MLVLGGLELGLRLAGYGYDTHFFRKLQIDGQDYYVPNEKFTYQFFPPALARTIDPFRIAAEKATNSYRIFLFGESAAMGDPDSTYSVGRYLEVLLRERYPRTDFQVVCVAITAIDSSTIVPIARECAGHQGDLWLIYMGNNEMVGPFGAETSYGFHAPGLGLIRAILAVKATRTGQLIDSLIRWSRRSSTPQKWEGMEMFAKNRLGYDDPARLRAYANFKANLEDILRSARKTDVPVVLSTVAVNLKDCAPFASMHAAGLDENQKSEWNRIYEQGNELETNGLYREALAVYQQATKIDSRFADLQFRMGQCDLALTNDAAARQEFELARDEDALDFRSDTRINAIIKEAAARHAEKGVYLLDAADKLAKNSPSGIPGLNWFYEHVHLNFAGNYQLALDFAEQARATFPSTIVARDTGNWASAETCNARLAATVWDRQRVWQSILNRVKAPPFSGQFNHEASLKMYEAKWEQVKSMMNTQTPDQARQMYEQALALRPDDYFLHGNYEGFLEKGGYLSQAIIEARRCCELVPQLPGGYYYTGTLLVRAGRISEAKDYFARALAIRSDYAEALNAMGEILANQQKAAEAIKWFKRAIRANPNYVEAYLDLGFLEQNQGNVTAAGNNYEKAASLEPEGPADYFNRANVAASLFQWDRAVDCLRGVVAAKPEFWQARYQLGVQLAAKGDGVDAEKQFSGAVAYRPDFIPARLEWGTVLASLGKTKQAIDQFQAVLQLDPANASARQQIKNIQSSIQRN